MCIIRMNLHMGGMTAGGGLGGAAANGIVLNLIYYSVCGND